MPLISSYVAQPEVFIGPMPGPMLPHPMTAFVVLVTVVASGAAAVLGVRGRRDDDDHRPGCGGGQR